MPTLEVVYEEVLGSNSPRAPSPPAEEAVAETSDNEADRSLRTMVTETSHSGDGDTVAVADVPGLDFPTEFLEGSNVRNNPRNNHRNNHRNNQSGSLEWDGNLSSWQ